ncbi:metal ABC transporter ATP-binding protein [Dehalogenimonas alkenigignens]|uniref:ABC-type Mn/Zn transport system, ATPase component n=1 Tax=Dehalogenimonas alkenigignens TaxID=1217799 RepID=A0A0W0GH63_9CHLR|nr:metal ABC transporter ATP-binding protein [Dehalogenimonas alkenigignens]KTB47902.1 ABC-type Mn/Zn transport system, ATPase component [Dehalogenimonas alkenigignens]PVV83905.1 metal ABC transporter ATP-binding protein [Dehalogenimonas alkenigignens]
MVSLAHVPDIAARGLTIGYNGVKVVDKINFELAEGQAIALIGTNGSGKSTLLKTIVGLLPQLGGDLQIFGDKPGRNPKRIAYLGQFHTSGFVMPLRAADVVSMGRYPRLGLMGRMNAEDRDIVRQSMAVMDVERLADAPLRALSGGQQQRIFLAQVLAHRADLLVLDEPTAGLDVGGRERYLQAIKDELCRGASVVVATHDVQDEAALCHQVMLLAHRVVALGPPDDVLTPQALLETFGIVIGGDQKRFTVLECVHPHHEHR